MNRRETVLVRRCPAGTPDDEVVRAVEAMVLDLPGLRETLNDKRKIVIKTNAGIANFTITQGHQTELTDPPVVEGVIRALRAMTVAEIVVGDAPTMREHPEQVFEGLGLAERLGKYPDVRVVDFGVGPFEAMRVPGEPFMFAEYQMHRDIAAADAFVSIAKMKAHRSLGCTLCMKNLFGMTPPRVYGYPRHYLHDRLIRLPRVMADLAAMMKPCVNVVDGITAANHGEWGGTPMTPGALVAGTNIVAIDATAARIMGFDPEEDYPSHPYFYRNNSIRIAAEGGLGPASAEAIDVVGEDPAALRLPFEVKRYGGTREDRDRELSEGARCVRIYRERRPEWLDRYRNRLVAFRDGEPLWDSADVTEHQAREQSSGLDWRNGPQFLVRVVPESEEIERLDAYTVYEQPETVAA